MRSGRGCESVGWERKSVKERRVLWSKSRDGKQKESDRTTDEASQNTGQGRSAQSAPGHVIMQIGAR